MKVKILYGKQRMPTGARNSDAIAVNKEHRSSRAIASELSAAGVGGMTNTSAIWRKGTTRADNLEGGNLKSVRIGVRNQPQDERLASGPNGESPDQFRTACVHHPQPAQVSQWQRPSPSFKRLNKAWRDWWKMNTPPLCPVPTLPIRVVPRFTRPTSTAWLPAFMVGFRTRDRAVVSLPNYPT